MLNVSTGPQAARSLAWLVLAAALIFSVPSVSAHRPGWGEVDGLTEIDNLVTSFAFYRDLGGGQADLYAFEARAGDRLHAGINIPAVSGLESYGVSVALLGPGLPEVSPAADLPEHPEGLGGLVFASQAGEDFFEPFTQTHYWGRQRLEVDLPQAGTYYLLVWQPAGSPGKYVMDMGTAEVFGPGDLLQFPVWWVRVHAFFGHTPYMISAAIALLAPAVAWVILRCQWITGKAAREPKNRNIG